MRSKPVPNLDRRPPFSGLHAISRDYLQARLRRINVPEGRCILPKGKRGRFMGIISKGKVELSDNTGKTHILRSGDSFGEGMLRFGVPSSYSASAKTDVTLWLVGRTDWLVAKELPSTIKTPTHTTKYETTPLWLKTSLIFLALVLMIFGPVLPGYAGAKLTRFAEESGYAHLVANTLRWAVVIKPESAQLQEAYGNSLFLIEENQLALDALQTAVELDEESASAQNNLGVVLMSTSRASEAIEHLLAAVDLDPGNAEFFYNLGNAYLENGENSFAAKAYQRALELDPLHLDAKALWAGISLESGDVNEAKLAWEQVIAVKPTHPLANKGLGVIAVLEGRQAQALPYLASALVSHPEDGTTRYYLGVALEALNRPVEAATEFEQAISTSSDPALINLASSHLQAIRPEQ